MAHIVSYAYGAALERRYVFSFSDSAIACTADRLHAKDYRTVSGALSAASQLRERGFNDVRVEPRRTLAEEQQQAAAPAEAAAPDADSPLNQHARRRIAELMEARGYTAADLPWSRHYVSDVLHGRKRLSRERMEDWARRLGVEPLQLFNPLRESEK